MANNTVNEVGPVTFESDPEARERIVQQVEEVLNKYQHDSRWKQIEEAMEGLSDRKLGAIFGAHIGSNYALKLNGKPVRLLVVGRDNFETEHQKVRKPSDFLEHRERGLKQAYGGRNWRGVQLVVWNVLQRGASLPQTFPYLIDVDGQPVDWLSGATFTNRYQRAVVSVEKGRPTNKSLSTDKSPTLNRDTDEQFANISNEMYSAILRALEPTHIVFHGKYLPEVNNIPERPSERLGPYGSVKRFRITVNSNVVEAAALNHPAAGRHGTWSHAKGNQYNLQVHPILATLLDGQLPEAGKTGS